MILTESINLARMKLELGMGADVERARPVWWFLEMPPRGAGATDVKETKWATLY